MNGGGGFLPVKYGQCWVFAGLVTTCRSFTCVRKPSVSGGPPRESRLDCLTSSVQFAGPSGSPAGASPTTCRPATPTGTWPWTGSLAWTGTRCRRGPRPRHPSDWPLPATGPPWRPAEPRPQTPCGASTSGTKSGCRGRTCRTKPATVGRWSTPHRRNRRTQRVSPDGGPARSCGRRRPRSRSVDVFRHCSAGVGSGIGGGISGRCCRWPPAGIRQGTGPAPVDAVRRGDIGLSFDTSFVFAEVNSDVLLFIEDPASDWGFRPIVQTNVHQ